MKEIILFIVIWFVAWLIKTASSAKEAQQAGENRRAGRRPAGGGAVRAGQPREGGIQNEIDQFLEEIGGRRRPKRPVREEAIEIVEVEEPPPRRPAVQRPQRPQPAVRPEPQPAPPARRAPPEGWSGGDVAGRIAPGTTGLGGSLQHEVTEHLDAHGVAEHVQEHLASHVQGSVQQHLGAFSFDTASDVQKAAVRNMSAEIKALLRSSTGARNAILMNEILSAPRGARR